MSLDQICYTNPFLKEAIIRVDFPMPCAALSGPLGSKLSKAALSKFPISEPQKLQAQEFQFSGANFSTNSREITQYTFHGKDREKSLIITPDGVAQTSKSYKTFELFLSDFLNFISALKEAQPDQIANRVGIRYVNVIEITKGNPLDWSEFVNEQMLGIIDMGNKENISRAFHILEFNFESVNLKCQFGIANPDYPATIRRKQFVLDLDAQAAGAFELNEIEQILKNGHQKIQEFFELSITEKTRTLMRPVQNELA